MQDTARGIDRRTFLAGAVVLGAPILFNPRRAYADPTSADKFAEAETVRSQITAMQNQVALRTEDYYRALDEHEAALQAVADAQSRIDEANSQIASLQDKLSVRARSMYRTGQSTLVDVVMGSSSFAELAQNWDILTSLNQNDADMVEQMKDLRSEVEAAKAELEHQEEIAADREAEAKRIKEETEGSVATLQDMLESLDAEARALLEQEQAAERAAAIAAAAAKQASVSSYSGDGSSIPSQGSVVDYALSRIGCPYVWGAEGPDAFDCSGLVCWAYAQVGISVPHQTESLYHAAKARLPVSEAQPGDVLWIGYGDGYNGHVGIACNEGGTHYVHAPTFGALVRDTDSLSWAGFTHALRF